MGRAGKNLNKETQLFSRSSVMEIAKQTRQRTMHLAWDWRQSRGAQLTPVLAPALHTLVSCHLNGLCQVHWKQLSRKA